jgi:hypothetical protein
MNKHFFPENFQMKRNKKNYFEGWYFKQVSKDLNHTISFIPGISKNKENSHSFIQCIYSNEKTELMTFNIKFDEKCFETNDNPFQVSIGNNSFSFNRIVVDLQSPDLKVSGQLCLGPITPINKSILCPNIMGFFSYIPNMECNHGLLSMSHSLKGTLTINDTLIDFEGGKGYIEKDWGRSFPQQYVWIQSNHFEDDTAGIFFSMATIPFSSLSFRGFICNFMLKGQEYRFATYNGAKLSVHSFTEESIVLELKKGKYTLSISASTTGGKDLLAPKDGEMTHLIKEVLDGQLKLILRDNESIIWEDSSTTIGLELVKKLKRT